MAKNIIEKAMLTRHIAARGCCLALHTRWFTCLHRWNGRGCSTHPRRVVISDAPLSSVSLLAGRHRWAFRLALFASAACRSARAAALCTITWRGSRCGISASAQIVRAPPARALCVL
jgi:hypothetical protein